MTLPDAELAFLCNLLQQLGGDARERFEARLAAFLLTHPDCGSGALGREVRAAFKASGWIPPPDDVGRLEARWARRRGYTTKLERIE